MPAAYGQSQDNLTALIARVRCNESTHRNEATTRLQLIDELLFDCLGWEKSECIAEKKFGGKFADYSLGSPYASLIVEAKKEDTYFEVPAGFNELTCRIQRLGVTHRTFMTQSSKRWTTANQEVYPSGLVCNGHQIVAFLASRTDGTPPI